MTCFLLFHCEDVEETLGRVIKALIPANLGKLQFNTNHSLKWVRRERKYDPQSSCVHVMLLLLLLWKDVLKMLHLFC